MYTASSMWTIVFVVRSVSVFTAFKTSFCWPGMRTLSHHPLRMLVNPLTMNLTIWWDGYLGLNGSFILVYDDYNSSILDIG